MKVIQTVCGPIPEEKLGITLMHEHCLVDSGGADGPYAKHDITDPEYLAFLRSPLDNENRAKIFFHMHKHLENQENLDEDLTIREMQYFKKAGGGTIVDVTSPGLGRNIRAMERIAKATGVNIVASTALYVEETHPEAFRKMSVRELADFFVSELKEGIEGTQIRAAYIGEIGMSDDFTDREQEVLKAAGIAAAQTGHAVTVHQPIFRTWGDRILDILMSGGAKPDQVVLSHCDPTLYNMDYHEGLLERGCRLQFDQFKLEFPCTYGPYVKRWLPRDIERIRHIKKLCDMGWEDKITVSMDMGAFKRNFRTYGGPGYAYIPEMLYDYFLFEGVTKEQMDKILIHNPRTILSMGADEA